MLVGNPYEFVVILGRCVSTACLLATVRKAIQKKTNKVVAVKCILVSKLTKEDEDALKVEIEVMKMVRFQ